MIGNFEKVCVTVKIDDLEVDGQQVTPRRLTSLNKKYSDDFERGVALFDEYVSDWRFMKDRDGNTVDCNESTKAALFEFDNGLAGRIITEIVQAIEDKQRQAEKN